MRGQPPSGGILNLATLVLFRALRLLVSEFESLTIYQANQLNRAAYMICIHLDSHGALNDNTRLWGPWEKRSQGLGSRRSKLLILLSA